MDDLSAATLRTSDSTPALAISPDGRIGVIWHRSVRDSNSDIKENIFFQSLTADGVATTGPVNLTNNTVFGRPYSDPNVPAFSEHSIAAANDGRFVMAWTSKDPSWNTTTWYAVRRSDGEAVDEPRAALNGPYQPPESSCPG